MGETWRPVSWDGSRTRAWRLSIVLPEGLAVVDAVRPVKKNLTGTEMGLKLSY
jgi:hypothetical protein